MLVILFRLLALCLTAPEKWKNFTGSPFGFLFHDSGYRESFLQVPKAHVSVRTLLTYQTRVVHSEGALWMTRMSELSRFVYVGSHVTLHVKSNA